MNVLFLSELFYPHGGGAELATYLYAKLLSELEFSVKVVTNRFLDEEKKSKIGKLEIFRLPLFKNASTLKYSMLTNLDVLFSGFLRHMVRWADVTYVPLFWYSAILLAKAYSRPVVTHLHNYILTCPLGTFYDYSKNKICHNQDKFLCPPSCIVAHERASDRKPAEVMLSALLNSVGGNFVTKIVAMSDAIICVSEAQRRLIARGCARSVREKLHVIYNPLPDIPDIDIEGDDFGYFGGPSCIKGFQTLYRAAKTINQYDHKAVKIHATKFQNASKTDTAFMNRIGLILHEKLDNSRYEKIYGEIRCIVIPSIWQEPLPYVVTEALLRRRIVIASDIGGIPEIAGDCSGAFMFEAGDYERLAENMLYVRDLNREDVIELGIKNRQNVMKKFNNERTVQKFINLLTEVT